MTETLPTLFAHKYEERAGSVEHCAVCGKKVSSDPAKVWHVATEYGGDPIPWDAQGGPHDSGAFPVGSECAKKFPSGFLGRAES
jgi:hypothetical protein